MVLKNRRKIFLITALLFDLTVFTVILCKPLMIQSDAEKNNKIIRLKCSLYDPFDPLKGRYVSLDFEETRGKFSTLFCDDSVLIPGSKDSDKIAFPSVYAIFENNKEGVSVLKKITISKPNGAELFLRCPAHYYTNADEIILDVNFCKYYIQEEHADKLDNMSPEDFNRQNPILELWVNGKGEAIQKELVFGKF